ncbi:MAG: hypothetical protein HETSPECPRED_002128 [Heterodermia speciosa]|uniref:Uncharacterized protein n=1 Tax=Heterodermia speciosa TaxID=116794 RepID=A0A8H3PGA8_9LECA|nr:MAG: hypothetical protein HETSPECPRED_002128 [Heterodermia speciosa]
MPNPNKLSFFASKAKKGQKAQQSTLAPGNRIKSQDSHAETSTQQQSHTPSHTLPSSSRSSPQFRQGADASSRIPQGTHVIELRDPVLLSGLVVRKQKQKKSGKTKSYRLNGSDSETGNGGGEEKPQADRSYMIPFGTQVVGLREPVPLDNLREMPARDEKRRK